MMKVLQMEVGSLGTNCYIAYCENTKKAVIIDPGGDAARILAAVNREGLTVEAIINTHGHADHVLANQMLAAGLAGRGWRLILTDGVSRVYTLAGGQTLHLSLPASAAGLKWSLSAIPITAVAAGLTYQEGLAYPLQRATLTLGSSRGVSNSFTGVPEVEISLEERVILLIATPEQ